VKFHKTLVIPDAHIPNHHAPSVRAVLKFAKYWKPDVFISLGDFCDWDSLSRFDLHHPKHYITMKREVEAANEMLDTIDRILPKTCKKYMVGGNHEDRYHQAKARHMFTPDKIARAAVEWKESWAQEYRLDKRHGWKWCEYGEQFKLGKLVYTHGWSVGKSNAAAKEASCFPGKNVLFGHTHRHQVSGCMDHKMNPIESETIGTLSRFDLAYLRNKPPIDWVHGFMYIYTRPDGDFTKAFVNIVKGRFIVNGRDFSG